MKLAELAALHPYKLRYRFAGRYRLLLSLGKLLNVLWKLKKKGYAETTIKGYSKRLKMVTKQVNLNVALIKRTNPKIIHIVPRKFLGKENFYKVMKVVKDMNGEWVSQGKHIYWWVPVMQKYHVLMNSESISQRLPLG